MIKDKKPRHKILTQGTKRIRVGLIRLSNYETKGLLRELPHLGWDIIIIDYKFKNEVPSYRATNILR